MFCDPAFYGMYNLRKVTNEDPLPSALVRVAQLLQKIVFQETETSLIRIPRGEAALFPPRVVIPRL